MSHAAATPSLLEQLRLLLGDRCVTSAVVREQHGRGESWHAVQAPDAVCFVQSEDEVAQLMRYCVAVRVPVIPFGAGTSLEGHVTALHGGICIDFSQMNRIIAVNADDLNCIVQPGVTRKQLNAHLKETGLFFPVDPGADATIGGMVATRASGTNAVRYGTIRENVLSLRAVMADGNAIKTAQRARKSAAGYDLTHLLIGSEGTLGLVTEITLRLHGVPDCIAAARVGFPSIKAAVDSVMQIIQCGIPVARIELLDAVTIDAINRYSKLELTPQPTLFLEFHGSDAGVREQADSAAELAAANGGGEFLWSAQQEERNRLWEARHNAYYATLALRPNCGGWISDVCVPISRLTDCIEQTRKDLAASFLPAAIVGHVGDGNFHVIFVVDPNDAREMDEVERLNERMVERALAMDGTCTGEHGIGFGKIKYLRREHGDAVEVMKQIKQALDPLNLLNPGKMVV